MTITVAADTPGPEQTTLPSPPASRFTIDGSQELEENLSRACDQVLQAVRRVIPPAKLEGLLLGGGYGRGEGGVLKTETGDAPYNDLEFYVFLRGNRLLNQRRYSPLLHVLAEELSPEATIEIEFKIISVDQLRHSPPSMFYYDLLMGHRWLHGDDSLLAGCDHHRDAERLPMAEATRLLMNRCSGLLFASERLQREPFTAEDADFVGRNLAKAQLAFGDAILAALGQYHWSCRERHRRLNRLYLFEEFAWLTDAFRNHAAGVEFKLHPYRAQPQRPVLKAQHATVSTLALRVWLELESRRLHYPFASARDYALHTGHKCPETRAWRNRLLNARAFGPRAFLRGQARRHPRDCILRALALLLWEDLSSRESPLLQQVRRHLQTNASAFPDLVRAYQDMWSQFS